MNTNNKQLIFNDVLTFIRTQGVGNPRMYCNVSGKMCSLGFLWSTLYGLDRLKRIHSTIYYANRNEDIVRDIVRKHPEIERQFFEDLSYAHDISTLDYLVGTDSQLRFEKEMKKVALKYNVSYNNKCKVIQFPVIEVKAGKQSKMKEDLRVTA